MGDANIDAEKWNDQDFPAAKRNLANQIQDFLLEDSFFQLVKDSTRSEVVNGSVQRSCIDHIYTNAPNKVDTPRVEAAGDSDHLAVLTTKYSKEVKLKPQTIKKRSYKNFNLGHFLSDIRDSDIVKDVVASSDIEEASKKFEDLFGSILDKHAPTKVFQIRKNYVPYLSNEAKLLMEERDALKTVGTKTNDPVLLQEFKQKRNEAKKKVAEDSSDYIEKEFEESRSISKVWKSVYNILGMNSNKSPTQLNVNGNLINSPKAMAVEFNQVFVDKV